MKNTRKPQGVASAVPASDAGKQRVGQVTVEERDGIQSLFERKNALLELFKSLSDGTEMNDAVYEKVVGDLGKVTRRFNEWWSAMSAKYQWDSAPDGHWEIDFDDGSIYLFRNPGRGAGAAR